MGTIHVSNRIVIPQPGEPTAGGLDEAIAAAPPGVRVTRLGWSGKVVPDRDYNKKKESFQVTRVGNVRYVTFDLSESQMAGFYSGTANAVLWPWFHGLSHVARGSFSQRDNAIYQEVNALFARMTARFAKANDTIMVHDYHLIPLGRELHKMDVKNPTGFFLHIPAPDHDLLDDLTLQEQEFVYGLTNDLFAYDLVGLQSRRDFVNLNTLINGAEASPDPYQAKIIPDLKKTFTDRATHFGVFPVVGRTADYKHQAEEWVNAQETTKFLNDLIGTDEVDIVGLERLDYTKGLTNKYSAVGICINEHGVPPDDIHFLQIAPPGRETVLAYQLERAKVEQAHQTLTQVFGPVAHLHLDKVRRELMLGIFRRSKIGLVTPLRDGFNLVALEYLTAQDPEDPGVLVLSKFCGAAEVLRDAAVLVDPLRPNDIARGIMKARDMTPDERQWRHRMAMARIEGSSNQQWQTGLVEATKNAAGLRPTA